MKHTCHPYFRLIGLLLVAAFTGTFADDGGAIKPAALYQRNCAACHGERGDGDSRARKSLAKEPRDFTAKDARQKLPREYMIAIVRDGKHEAPMVGRKSRLSQAQIEAIVDFIRAAFMPPEPGSSLARGREFYLQACAGCHGARGQGGSFRDLKSPSPPFALSNAGVTLTRDQLIVAIGREEHATVHGKIIAGFATQLSASEIEAITDYIISAFIGAGYTGKALSPTPAKAD